MINDLNNINIDKFLYYIKKIHFKKISVTKKNNQIRMFKMLIHLFPIFILLFIGLKFDYIINTEYSILNTSNVFEIKQNKHDYTIKSFEVPYIGYRTPDNEEWFTLEYKFDGQLTYINGLFDFSKNINCVKSYNIEMKDNSTIYDFNLGIWILILIINSLCAMWIIFIVLILFDKDVYDCNENSFIYFFKSCYQYNRFGEKVMDSVSTVEYIIFYIKRFFNMVITLDDIEKHYSISILHPTHNDVKKVLTKDEHCDYTEVYKSLLI